MIPHTKQPGFVIFSPPGRARYHQGLCRRLHFQHFFPIHFFLLLCLLECLCPLLCFFYCSLFPMFFLAAGPSNLFSLLFHPFSLLFSPLKNLYPLPFP